MPIYDYVCGSCGHVVEVIHSISAAGPSVCERCGGAMKRALSTPAIVFKGSGWAKKDARDAVRAKSSGTATTDAPATDGTGGDAATTAETPAATSTTNGTSGSAAATTASAGTSGNGATAG